MVAKWTGPTFTLLCLCVLASGCATRIQKSLDRSVLIAKRCADIEEAVPNRKDVEGELINAIALRLVATCYDGKQGCLGPTPVTAPPNVVSSAENLLTDLEQYQTGLLLVNQKILQANKYRVESLQKAHNDLRRELTQRRNNIVIALNNLYSELQNARAVLKDSLSKASACERRTSCVATLGRQLSTIRLTLDTKVRDLHQKMQDLQVVYHTAQKLADQTITFLDEFSDALTTAAETEQETVRKATNQLKRDTVDLMASSTFLVQRLEAGSRALDSLFSAEVQDAATDLLAARLYDKVADKTVLAIDRLLSQVDRTIDKVDEHAYGAATLGTYLFEDKMQETFDRIFTAHIADRLPDNSKTAKLALAAAACKRLVPDNDNGIRNASLFSSFVYAALIRIQVDLEDKKNTPGNVRKEWEQSLNKIGSGSVDAEKKADTGFLNLVAEAYRADSSPAGVEQRAPSILQQVALCANVEQQLTSTRQLGPVELKERSWAACGKAVMSATLMGQGLTDASSPVLAQQAIEKATPLPSVQVPNGRAGPEDAFAWSHAMEAMLAASAQKKPSRLERLCQRIRSSSTAVHCESNESGNAITLDFDANFAVGKVGNRTLEALIARLADTLGEDKQPYIFRVYGYASVSAYSCIRSVARTPAPCGAEKNYALAKARADWALSVLRKRLGERFASDSQAVGLFNPLSFDTPTDRRIRMIVALQN